MILELDNVELYFKSKLILSGIYLRVETGSITTISGSNGSGKSSILRIIFGDLTPKYKLIRINGEPQLGALYKSGVVKYLPQDSFVPKSIKVSKAFKIYGVKIEEFFEEFEDFEPKPTQKFSKLSRGEKRLIEIFLILKSKSNIVLLDSPFENLSPINIEKVSKLILAEKHKKLIIATGSSTEELQRISDAHYNLASGHLKTT